MKNFSILYSNFLKFLKPEKEYEMALIKKNMSITDTQSSKVDGKS
jgi:hypothetical protein